MSGTIGGDSKQVAAFHERLMRIESKVATGAQTCFVGDDMVDLREIRAKTREKMRRRARYRTGMFWSLIAVLTTATAVIAVRAVRADFYSVLLTGNEARGEMLTDLGLALAVALFLRQLLGFRWRWFAALQLPAVVAMVLGMHNLVHYAPDAFARVFPEPWVETVLSTTEKNSLLIPGKSIRF